MCVRGHVYVCKCIDFTSVSTILQLDFKTLLKLDQYN